MPRAHARALGEILHRQLCDEIFARPGQDRAEAAGRRLEFEQRGKLRLSATAAMIEYELPRGLLDDRLAMILSHHRKRQIDTGGDSSGTPDLTVAHEDLVGLELHLRIGRKKLARVLPVRRGALAIEKARLGKHEGSGANAGDARTAARDCADEIADA